MYQYFSKLIPVRFCQKYRRDSEFIIVTNMANKFLYLNNTAADFFELCDGQNTINDIVHILLSEYDVEIDVLQRDIISIIRDFQWGKIIKLSKKKVSTVR